MWQGILLAGAGGFGGASARYLAVHFVTVSLGVMPYYGTLAVNVAGSLAAGVFLAVPFDIAGASARILCVTGFLGGFTTFSAFSADTLLLVKSGHIAAAFINIAANVVLSLGAAYAGFAAVDFILRVR